MILTLEHNLKKHKHLWYGWKHSYLCLPLIASFGFRKFLSVVRQLTPTQKPRMPQKGSSPNLLFLPADFLTPQSYIPTTAAPQNLPSSPSYLSSRVWFQAHFPRKSVCRPPGHVPTIPKHTDPVLSSWLWACPALWPLLYFCPELSPNLWIGRKRIRTDSKCFWCQASC